MPEPVGFSSAAGRSPWRVITASSRVSRSGRSPIVSVARPRRSRRTSTTDRGEGACGQGPLRGRLPRVRRVRAAAQRQGGTRACTARRATRARSSGAGPASGWWRRCVSGVFATASFRRRTTGRARTRVAVGAWPFRASLIESGRRRAWSPPVRYVEHRSRGGCGAVGGHDEGAGVGAHAIWQGAHLLAETPGIDRKNRGSEGRRAHTGTRRFVGTSHSNAEFRP